MHQQGPNPVSLPLPRTPDSMPLREALRGLRHVLRQGGGSLRDTGLIEVLPSPAAQLAGRVLRGVDALARNVDQVASDVAKSVLGGREQPVATFGELTAQADAETRFGAAAYTALRAVLTRLGAPDAFISEAAARRVFARQREQHPVTDPSAAAVDLTLGLIDARVVRGIGVDVPTRVSPSALEPVAVFAVMLWLQSERSEAENEETLTAACDLSVAIAGDVIAACAAHDAARLAALYAEFVPHV